MAWSGSRRIQKRRLEIQLQQGHVGKARSVGGRCCSRSAAIHVLWSPERGQGAKFALWPARPWPVGGRPTGMERFPTTASGTRPRSRVRSGGPARGAECGLGDLPARGNRSCRSQNLLGLARRSRPRREPTVPPAQPSHRDAARPSASRPTASQSSARKAARDL